MKKGKTLERLIEHIERTFADEERVKVEAPKRLRDRTTGRLREHDVVLTINQGHHEMKIAIECRDRSRPVTVNQVEAFGAKCQDTGIAQAAIVSTMGFYQSAREKAAHLGIRCLDLEQAVSFDWLLSPGVTIFHRLLKHAHWTIFPDQQISDPLEDFKIVDDHDVEITTEILNANICRQDGNLENPETAPQQQQRFVFQGHGLFLEHKATKERIPIRSLFADAEFEISIHTTPFDLVKYVDKETGCEITDAAVASLNVGPISGKLMFIYKFGDKGKVFFLQDSKDLGRGGSEKS